MPRIPVRLSRSAFEANAKPFALAELQNAYLEFPESDSSADYAITTFPGLKVWGSFAGGDVRGLFQNKEQLYVVSGGNVYSVNENKSATSIGSVLDDGKPVRTTNNLTEIGLVSSERGYVISAGATNLITDLDFPTPIDIAQLGGLATVIQKNTDEIHYSATDDFTDWTALGFLSAEARPDDLVALVYHRAQLWAFGKRSTQAFQLQGGLSPIANMRGYEFDVGCASRDSAIVVSDVIMWVSERGFVYMMTSEGPRRVSNRGVEKEISGSLSALRAIEMNFAGHVFYVITAPNTCSYGYSVGGGYWVRLGNLTTDDYPGLSSVWAYGKQLVGGRDGVVYELDEETHTEAGNERRTVVTTEYVQANGEWLFAGELELEIESGNAPLSGAGSDPQIMMQYSDNDGRTWSAERWRSVGKTGEYNSRVRWRRLGRFKRRIFRFAFSDPVKLSMVRCFLSAEVGNV